MAEDLVTVAQAAHILGVSRFTIYSWRRRHYISPASVSPAGIVLFSLAELERCQAERPTHIHGL